MKVPRNMAELKALPTAVLIHIAKLLNVPLKGMTAVIELLDEGATVPFIARYRKEVTGNLDEVQIRDIQEKLEYFRELEDRRETVLASIEEQGKLTPELKAQDRGRARKDRTRRSVPAVQAEAPHQGVDRARKGTGAAGAVSVGPAAGRACRSASSPRRSNEAGSAEEALEGARHIVAEWISENAEFRKAVRGMMMADGRGRQPRDRRRGGSRRQVQDVRASTASRRRKIPSHRMLAIRRGAKEGVLTFEIELERAEAAGVAARAGGPRARRMGAAPGSGRRGLLRPPAQSVDPDRSPAGTEGPLGRRGDQGFPRESGEPAALAAGRHADRARDRPGHSHRLQDRGGGRHRQVPGERRHLPVRAEERSGRLGEDAGVADRAAQRAGHRDRQRHGIARDRRPSCRTSCGRPT